MCLDLLTDVCNRVLVVVWQLRRELKAGAVVFAVIGLVKPSYYLYKVVKVSFA